MVRILAAVLVAVAGLVHLLPVSGVLGAAQLHTLYGLPLDDPGLVLLLRHRALLFGLLGLLLVAAAFRPALMPLALCAGLVSVVGFLGLAAVTDGYGAAIERIVVADWLALGCLLVAAVLHWMCRRRHASGT